MKRKGGSGKERASPGKYGTAGVSEDYKLGVADVAWNLRQKGMSWAEVVASVATPSYAPTERTLRHHLSKRSKGESPFKDEKRPGPKALLTLEQKEVIAGWCLLERKGLDLVRVKAKIKELFDVDMSESTVSRYVSELNLSFQLLGSRFAPAGMTREEYVMGYYQWVLDRHNDGFFSCARCDLGCIDFFTDSRRTERVRTINGRGQKQKKGFGHKPKYTTSFMVGIWRDDDNWTQSLAFTHNPDFAQGSPRANEIQRMCDKYEVARDRIYYTPADKKYCKECNIQVRTFCERYKEVLEGCHVIHDDGNSFKYESELIFEEYALRVSVMPPAQHGELSTCDNNFNSIVKQRWRAERWDDGDQARDVIMLLSFCDDVADDVVTRLFDRNYLLDGRGPTIERVTEFLNGGNRDPDLIFEGYKERYLDYIADIEQIDDE